MKRSAALLLILAALPACENQAEKSHERYLEARRKFAAVYARSLSDECREEPACGEAMAVFEAIPAEDPDHADARAILERIRVARERRAAVQKDFENARAAPPPVFPTLETEEEKAKRR